MADAACLSRARFQRVFRQTMGEAPGRLQRRLVLERAAYSLRVTDTPITAIAFEAGYQTPEGLRKKRTLVRIRYRYYRNEKAAIHP